MIDALKGSALARAFLVGIIVLGLLALGERGYDFGWVMWHGGGTWLPIAAFLGVLGYDLGKQYLRVRR